MILIPVNALEGWPCAEERERCICAFSGTPWKSELHGIWVTSLDGITGEKGGLTLNTKLHKDHG
jgi:hypothetical protein